MDPTVTAAIVGGVVVVLSSLVTYLGVRFNARQLAEAATRGAELEESRVQLDEDRVDLERIESLAKEVRDLREQLRDDRAEHHAEVVQLRNDHAAQLRTLTERIEGLERLRARDRTEIRTLTDYVRVLLALLRQHEITHPAPPPGLD